MQNRRITALLLTAFLVAEVVWHWQTGQSRLATAPGVWSEVATGAYRAVGRGFLVPVATGRVLVTGPSGSGPAQPLHTYSLPGQRVEVYAHGAATIAVAVSQNGATQPLQTLGSGFVTVDSRQSLWLVDASGVHLLVGGTVGEYSRDMLISDAKATKELPRNWRLLWVADPVVVGSDVWYISNRDQTVGSPDFYVWEHTAQGDERITTLDSRAPLDLLGAGSERVFAEQQGTTLVVLDARTESVVAQLPDTLPLTIAQAGTAALLEEFSGGQSPRLAVYVSGDELVPLPTGIGNPGVASFSSDGKYLCLIVHASASPAIYVARLGPSGIVASTTIHPPKGAQVVTDDPPSEAGGRIFVVVRMDGQMETWSRSVDDGQGTF